MQCTIINFFTRISVQSLPPCQKRSSGVGSHQLFHRNNCRAAQSQWQQHKSPVPIPTFFLIIIGIVP